MDFTSASLTLAITARHGDGLTVEVGTVPGKPPYFTFVVQQEREDSGETGDAHITLEPDQVRLLTDWLLFNLSRRDTPPQP
jgi:hypothetical protein